MISDGVLLTLHEVMLTGAAVIEADGRKSAKAPVAAAIPVLRNIVVESSACCESWYSRYTA
jgi:hypothetical protein